MNKTYRNIIKKTIITIALVIVTMPLSTLAYLGFGNMIGTMLHPLTHHVECECDRGPIMTKAEAILLAIFYLCVLMAGMFFFLRKLKFSKREQAIALIILFLFNGLVCFMLKEFLYMTATG